MPTKDFILLQLAQLKPVLKEQFGIARIGLFGSYAKNCATESSDIDLLVEYFPYYAQNYQNLIKLETLLKRSLVIDKIELVDARYMNPVISIEAKKSLIYV